MAEAALPALQRLADALVGLASQGDEILTVIRALGEVLVAAVAKLLESVNLGI